VLHWVIITAPGLYSLMRAVTVRYGVGVRVRVRVGRWLHHWNCVLRNRELRNSEMDPLHSPIHYETLDNSLLVTVKRRMYTGLNVVTTAACTPGWRPVVMRRLQTQSSSSTRGNTRQLSSPLSTATSVMHCDQFITTTTTTLCSEKNTPSRFLLYLRGKCLGLHKTFSVSLEELSILWM